MYEFLYGIPPFNADSPPHVFENILMRKIDWMEGEVELSTEARLLMEGLMTHDVEKRVGTKSSSEVKSMSWFDGTDWENLSNQKVYFVPTVKNIEDTDYFDSRGVKKPSNLSDSDDSGNEKANTPGHVDGSGLIEASDVGSPAEAIPDEKEDFGEAVLKNLPLLEKQNQQTMDQIKQEFPEGEQWLQRRRESITVNNLPYSPGIQTSFSGAVPGRSVSPTMFSSHRDSLPNSPGSTTSLRSLSPKRAVPSSLLNSALSSIASLDQQQFHHHGISTSGARPFDSKSTSDYTQTQPKPRMQMPPTSQSVVHSSSTPFSYGPSSASTSQSIYKNSLFFSKDGGSFWVSKETSALIAEDSFESKTNSTLSVAGPSSNSDRKSSQAYLDIAKQNLFEQNRHRESVMDYNYSGVLPTGGGIILEHSSAVEEGLAGSTMSIVRGFDILIAESNPAAAQILETILTGMNCRCFRVKTGAEVVQCAMGDVKFDLIFCDISLPVSKF